MERKLNLIITVLEALLLEQFIDAITGISRSFYDKSIGDKKISMM
jgi:hypothetical protein